MVNLNAATILPRQLAAELPIVSYAPNYHNRARDSTKGIFPTGLVPTTHKQHTTSLDIFKF